MGHESIAQIPHSRPWISPEDVTAVASLTRSGQLASGEVLEKFEIALSEHLRVPSIRTMASGRQGLFAALLTLKLPPKAEVILPTYCCDTVLNVVRESGANPVLCDIGEHWNMTRLCVERKLSSRTAAIVIVQLFGITERLEEFRPLGVPIVNDLCQNFDAAIPESKMAWDRGDIAVFSFHPTKCLTSGLGGAVAAFKAELGQRLPSVVSGLRSLASMTDIQAALGLSQLSRYREFQTRRHRLASEFFGNLPEKVGAPMWRIRERASFYRFLLRDEKLSFESFRENALRHGVLVKRPVPTLLHRGLGLDDRLFPNAVKAFRETVSLPFYPSLSEKEVERILNAVG